MEPRAPDRGDDVAVRPDAESEGAVGTAGLHPADQMRTLLLGERERDLHVPAADGAAPGLSDDGVLDRWGGARRQAEHHGGDGGRDQSELHSNLLRSSGSRYTASFLSYKRLFVNPLEAVELVGCS